MKILLSILGTGLVLAVLAAICWAIAVIVRRSDEPLRVFTKWGISAVLFVMIIWAARLGPFGVLAAAVIGIVLGGMWAPHLAALIASPITSTFDGGLRELESKPFYSIAQSRRKQGRYEEAIAETRKQLARFPGDFTGLILLAEIQAEGLKDPGRAFGTIDEILEQEGLPAGHIAYALNRAADWHLKFQLDPELARLRLEKIVELCPDTEQAQLALQRIAHLASPELLKDQQDPHVIPLKQFQSDVGLREKIDPVEAAELEPGVAAANFIEHLNQHPNDNEARENLALIYAHDYQRLDLATEQLELLINTPNQQPKQVVHWLNVLVDLQIKVASDAALARQTLQRIVERFPKSAAAENALSRMNFLNLELRKNKTSQVVKLGSYEQNIGLKGRSTSEDAGQSESQSR